MTEEQLIIRNAAIWSDGRMLPHTVLKISDGRISALGGDELLGSESEARVIDAEGGLVTPGFADSHVHALYGGIEANRCDLAACEDLDAVYATIARYADEHPDEPWILGGGWHMPLFPGGIPLAEDLDRIVPDRPVYLINSDHHGAWANSSALELAGVTADTPDPSDGRIERDASGAPSGTLHEGATDLVGRVLPETTEAEGRAGLLTSQQLLFSLGITAWQEAILGAYAGYPDLTEVYRQLVDSGELRGRATGALWVARDFAGMTIPEFVELLVERRERFDGDGLQLNTAKIMVDGVPENETAAMNDPYQGGDPAHTDSCGCAPARGNGLSYFTREQLVELLPLLNANGFGAHMHAIGDRAVRYALDAIEAVPAETRAGVRNHIAHIQVVDPQDVPRFAELGATVNAQMLWACRDAQMVDLTLPLLGEQRAGWQYPFASILHSGAEFACGSDWPVSTPDPWQAIHVAVNRQEPGDTSLPPLVPEEALTLDEALTGYTRGSQRLLGTSPGVIELGAAADLAIADRNPFAVASEELYETRNRCTIVGGEVVFER